MSLNKEIKRKNQNYNSPQALVSCVNRNMWDKNVNAFLNGYIINPENLKQITI